jgi:hypothetical protein
VVAPSVIVTVPVKGCGPDTVPPTVIGAFSVGVPFDGAAETVLFAFVTETEPTDVGPEAL